MSGIVVRFVLLGIRYIGVDNIVEKVKELNKVEGIFFVSSVLVGYTEG